LKEVPKIVEKAVENIKVVTKLVNVPVPKETVKVIAKTVEKPVVSV